MTENIQIVKYKNSFKPSLLDLLGHKWQNLSVYERKERFEWRYEKNPYQDKPFVFLALGGNSGCGLSCICTVVFCVTRKKHNVFSPGLAIAHPAYRRRGFFSKPNNAFLEEVNRHIDMPGNILTPTSNRFSTPGHLKQYWQETNVIKRFYHKYSFPTLLKKYAKTQSELPAFFSRKDLDFEYLIG